MWASSYAKWLYFFRDTDILASLSVCVWGCAAWVHSLFPFAVGGLMPCPSARWEEGRTGFSNSQAWTITSFPWSTLFQIYCAFRYYIFKHMHPWNIYSHASLVEEHTTLTLDFTLKEKHVSNSYMTKIDRIISLLTCQGTPLCSLGKDFSRLLIDTRSPWVTEAASVHAADASRFPFFGLSKAQNHRGSRVLHLKPMTQGSSVSFCLTFLFQ